MDNHIIPYYTIIYDCDPGQVYFFTDFKKVLSSVESSLYGYILDDDNKQAESAINKCISSVRDLENAPIVPIIFENLQIMINRWEMDNSCNIHKILVECYEKCQDDDLKDKIKSLFSAQV